jgi:hypothetical protein
VGHVSSQDESNSLIALVSQIIKDPHRYYHDKSKAIAQVSHQGSKFKQRHVALNSHDTCREHNRPPVTEAIHWRSYPNILSANVILVQYSTEQLSQIMQGYTPQVYNTWEGNPLIPGFMPCCIHTVKRGLLSCVETLSRATITQGGLSVR